MDYPFKNPFKNQNCYTNLWYSYFAQFLVLKKTMKIPKFLQVYFIFEKIACPIYVMFSHSQGKRMFPLTMTVTIIVLLLCRVSGSLTKCSDGLGAMIIFPFHTPWILSLHDTKWLHFACFSGSFSMKFVPLPNGFATLHEHCQIFFI